MTDSADYDATCYGHWGPGMLRAWDECPVCNPEDDSDIPPEVGDQ